MIEQDFEQFTTAIQGLGEMYNRQTSSQLIAMYWQALKQYDYNTVSQAVQRHYSDPEKGAFFPKPGDIILWIDGGMEDRSQLAWAKVERAVRVVGPYQSVAFDDAVIHAVIEQMGGWPKLCSHPDSRELKFAGIQFTKLYRANRNTKDFPAKLSGIADSENQLRGSKASAPVLIGDSNQAKQVLANGSENARIGVTRTDHTQIEEILNQAPVGRLINEVA